MFFEETNIFPQFFLTYVKNNPNKHQFIPSEVKVVLKIMAMEQGLCEKVVMIHQKHSDNKKEKENKNNYNFPEKSTISIRWFDLDHEWLEEKFRTCDPGFY